MSEYKNKLKKSRKDIFASEKKLNQYNESIKAKKESVRDALEATWNKFENDINRKARYIFDKPVDVYGSVEEDPNRDDDMVLKLILVGNRITLRSEKVKHFLVKVQDFIEQKIIEYYWVVVDRIITKRVIY